MGSTIANGNKRVTNDDYKPVRVQGAYNLPIILKTLELDGTASPGEGCMPKTGANGENKITLADDKSPRCNGVFEIDFGQIEECAEDYEDGDEVPFIPFNANIGAILRNIQCVDPEGNVDPLTPLTTSSGTAGSFKILTEATLSSETGSGGYVLDAETLGTNGESGNMFLNWLRTPLMQRYYKGDPDGAYTTVASILHG